MIRVNFAIQKDSGIYKRILFTDSSGSDTSTYNFSGSVFDPEITPRVELAEMTVTLSGTDLIVSLAPSLLAVTLGTGETQKALAHEILLLDPGVGFDVLISAGDVVYTLGGSA